mgnify:FL=1
MNKLKVPDPPVIQTLWVGDTLSAIERLCLSSFVYPGHNIHLYAYSDIDNIPEGVVVKDGNEILPESMIFEYKEYKSFSGFSNYFRYKLLTDKGGYWVDTDIVCLKPFDFTEPFVFCSEEVLPLGQGNTHVGSCLIKAPKDNPLTSDAYNVCLSKKPEDLDWGEIGPSLVKEMVEKYNMQNFVKHPYWFCPVPGCMWQVFLNPNVVIEFDETTYAVHLWNEMWRRAEVDKNQKFHPDCLYEKWKKEFNID